MVGRCETSGWQRFFFHVFPLFFLQMFHFFCTLTFCVCDQAEKDLIFAGFIAFECLVRKDSALVIGALNESGHKAGRASEGCEVSRHVMSGCDMDRITMILTYIQLHYTCV